MKTFKRIASVALALIMVFGSVSLLANAVETDLGAEPGIYSKISTKFFREDPDTGDWIETDRAAKGDEIRVRVYIDTDYAVGAHKLFWVYPNEFMTFQRELYNDSNGTLTSVTRGRNPIYFEGEEGPVYDALFEVEVVQAETPGGASATDVANRLITDGYMTEADFEGLGWVFLQIAGMDYCTQLSGDYYAYEFAFMVNEDATGVGTFQTPEASVMTPEKPTGAYSLTKSYNGEGGMVNAKDRDFRDFYADFNLAQDATLVTTSAVTFDAGTNGKVSGTGVYNIDIGTATGDLETFAVPSATANTGYDFVGWSLDGVTYYEDAADAPEGATDVKTFTDLSTIEVGYTDIALAAVYEEVEEPVSTYTVTFKQSADGEEITSVPGIESGAKLDAEEFAIAAEDLEVPEGKEFAYWTLLDGTTKVDENYEITADITLIPYYTDITVDVTFKDSDGEDLDTLAGLPYGYELTADDLDSEAELLTGVEGKTFAYWTIDGAKVNAGYIVKKNVTLVPYYTDNSYTVTFKHSADGEEIDNLVGLAHNYELTEDDLSIMAEELVPAAGKQFANWALADGTDVLAGYKVTSDLVLVPEYSDIKYTVTFYADEAGTLVHEAQTDAYTYNGALVYPATNPAPPEGKYFDGWSVAAGTAVTGNMTVTPTFTTLTYDVEFQDAEGNVINTYDSIAWGTEFTAEDLAIEAEDLPEVEGKTFASWQVDGADVTSVTVKSGLVLTPRYKDNKYTVTFQNADGNEIHKIENVVHGTTLTAEQIAAAEAKLPSLDDQGLKYTGWDVDTAAAITGATVLKATTAKEAYTVKFVTGIDGVTAADLPVAYDEDITAKLEQLSAEGLNFKGWVADLDTKAPAATKIADLGEDGATVTYYAYWTKTVTFVDGETETPVEVDKDAAILDKAPAFAGKGDDYEAGVWYDAANGAGNELTADAKATADAAATYYAYYAAKTDLTYTIEIYEEVLGKDGEYALADTVTVTDGVAGKAIVYNEARTGFKNPTLDTTAATVVASGAVAKVKYDRVDDITITVNGTPDTYEYGEQLNPEVPETTEGQEFDKWVDAEGNEVKVPTAVTPDMDGLELIAKYKYVITFIDQGATTKNDAQAEGTAIVAPAEKGKADYEFKGWFTAVDGAGAELKADTLVTGAVTYYAYYEAKTDISYTIAIYEEKLTADKVAGEDEYVLVDEILVENAKAGGAIVYNEARTGFKAPVLDPADAVVANGITVKAMYDRVDDISITVNGTPDTYEYGEQLNPEVPETTEGQVFDKWVDENGDEVKVPTAVTPDMDGLNITAAYKYVITFIVDGEPVKDDAQAEGAAIVAPADPSITGYTFDGWYTAEDGAGDELAADAKVTGVATYYAKLTVKKNALTFTDDDGKTVAEYADVEFGADLNALAPEAPAVSGMTFAGWVDSVTGAPMPETMPETVATYKPTYTNNGTVKYTVETYFMDVNGDYTTKTVTTTDGILGTKVTVEDKSDENVGYYLDTEKSIMSAESLTAGTVLKAYYARNEVTVTFFDYDGITVLGTYTGLYGSKITYPATEPTREYHTFTGWDSEPATAPVEDITITATYERVPVVLVNNKTTAEGKNVVIDRENPDQMIIYGFMVNDLKNQDDYSRYLAVEGDGTFKVVPVANGKYGTGTKIELYDNYDGALKETYFIVIYGDVDGDANVGSNDISIIRDEILRKTSWSDDTDVNNYNAIRVLAADINKSGTIQNNDLDAVIAQVNTTAEINQATREVIYNS